MLETILVVETKVTTITNFKNSESTPALDFTRIFRMCS
jgi:hypothetical protein